MALYGERKAFYDTKTTCFGIVMLNGTFLRTSILPNKLTLNKLEAKMTLLQKTIKKNLRGILTFYDLKVQKCGVTIDKTKKLSFYLVLSSLIRIFEALLEDTLARQNKKTIVFIWFCPHLFVSLHS